MACPYGCVLLAFKVIDPGMLKALAGALEAAIGQLAVMEKSLQFKLAMLDSLLAPVREQYAALQKMIEDERQKLNIVPQEYVAVCPELGILQQYLQKVIDQLLEQIDAAYRRLQDMLDLRLKLAYELAMVAQLKKFLQEVLDCLKEALQAGRD